MGAIVSNWTVRVYDSKTEPTIYVISDILFITYVKNYPDPKRKFSKYTYRGRAES